MAELDELKDRGRTPEVRQAAECAVKRIKGFRDRACSVSPGRTRGTVRGTGAPR